MRYDRARASLGRHATYIVAAYLAGLPGNASTATLLPVQLRHGARLIGRWETEDGRVIAVWEYDDRAAYERIDSAVRTDPDSVKAQQHRAELPPLITAREETFMTATIPGNHLSAGR